MRFPVSMVLFVVLVVGQARADSPTTDADLEVHWQSLAAPANPAGERDAFQAIGALVAYRGSAVAFLHSRVRPVEPVEHASMSRWITNLESTDFATRQEAMDRIREEGRSVYSQIARKLADRPSLDLRKRLEELIQSIEAEPLTTEELRALRAIEVLEKIGTRDAWAMMKELAQGAPDAPATQAALAALNRHTHRKVGG